MTTSLIPVICETATASWMVRHDHALQVVHRWMGLIQGHPLHDFLWLILAPLSHR